MTAINDHEILARATESLNAHDLDALADELAEDVVFHAPGLPGGQGKAACLRFYRGWFADFPDARLEVERRHILDDLVVEEGTFIGTHDGVVAPTGRSVRLAYIRILGLRDGKHVFFNLLFDRLSLLEQLGLMPVGRWV